MQTVNDILVILILAELVLAAVLRRRIWRGTSPVWRANTPRGVLAILLVLVGLLSVIALVLPLFRRDGDAILTLVLSMEALIGLLLAGSCRAGVIYDETGFTHRGFFSPARRFSYADITGIRGWNTTELWCGKRKIRLDTSDDSPNSDMKFLSYAKTQYRRQMGREIPPTTRKDVFRGNVDDPDALLCLAAIVILVTAGGTVWQAAEALKPYRPEELEHRTLTFCEYGIKNNAVWLWSEEDDLRFKLDGIEDAVRNLPKLKRNCNGSVYFKAAVDNTEATDQRGYYIIADLRDETDTVYTTYELASAQKWRRERIMVFLWGSFLAAMIVWLVMMVIVGRNPELYSEKMIRTLFERKKDGQLPNVLTAAERKKLQSRIEDDPRLRVKRQGDSGEG